MDREKYILILKNIKDHVMKKIIIIILFTIFLSANVFSQLDFKNVVMQVPGSTTTMGAVQIGDVTNDGLNDVIVGSATLSSSPYEYNLFVYAQKPDGTLADPIKLHYGYGMMTGDIQIADINKDGLNDIVFSFGGSIGIYYQLPGGGFSSLKTLTGTVGSSYGIRVADFNNDGLKDILGFYNGNFQIFYQNQSGDFNLTSIPAQTSNCTQIECGDLNGDNLTDIAKIYGSKIEILYQKQGSGITNESSFVIDDSKVNAYFTGIAFGDLDNNGKNDIIVSYGGNSGRINIYHQTSNGKIDTVNVKTINTYDMPMPVRIADLNCDGDKEIIVGHHGWQNISVFNKYNQSDYSTYTLFPSLYYFTPFSMAVGDINNDGRPDIVDVDQDAKINILYNTSKPLTFDSYEHKVAGFKTTRDTTTTQVVNYTAIIDTASYCKKNKFIKQLIIQTFNNEHYSGDSLFIRHAVLCSAYTDTIATSFTYSKNFNIKNDTTYSIENRDIIQASIWNPVFYSKESYTNVAVNANICWTLTTDKDWIKPEKSSGTGDDYINFTISQNPSTTDRKGIITVSGDSVPPAVINIYQYGATPLLDISTSTIILNDSVNQSSSFEITSNVNWTITKDVDWISMDRTTGSGNDTINIQATLNTTTGIRQGILTITGEDNLVQTIEVKQLKTGLNSLNELTAAGIKIYPVPTAEKLYVESGKPTDIKQIQLCDLSGTIVYSCIPTGNKTGIDLSNLGAGIYFLKINTDTSAIIQKIIKN